MIITLFEVLIALPLLLSTHEPPSAGMSTRSLYAAAQKTSRIVDQNPLKQEDGSPCTFALQCCDEGPRVSAKLIFAWLQELENAANLTKIRVVPERPKP